MSNFFEYQANGDKDVEKNPQPQETVVQDQDTVIGDAMCEASQLFYDAANQIARCISENNQVLQGKMQWSDINQLCPNVMT